MASMLHLSGVRTRSIVFSLIQSKLGRSEETLDLDKSFVQLGGNSLTALSLSSALIQHSIKLSVISILTVPSIRKLLEHAEKIEQVPTPPPSIFGEDVFSFSRSPDPLGTWQPPTPQSEPESELVGPPRKRVQFENAAADHIHLTDMQLALVAGGLRRPGTNMIRLFDSYAAQDLPRMKNAWEQVIKLEKLTGIDLKTDIGNALKAVPQSITFEWTETCFHESSEYIAELQRPCLESPVSSRFKILTLDQHAKVTISTIVWEVHHALVDGYAASLLYEKVHQAAAGFPIKPGPCFATTIKDIERLQMRDSAFLKNFWRMKQDQYPSASGDFTFPRPLRMPSASSEGTRTLKIPVFNEKLMSTARDVGVTIAAVHYAIWALVLSKFTDADSIVFGAVHSGRSLPIDGLMAVTGPTINTLPFYTRIAPRTLASKFLTTIFHDITELDSVQASTPEDGFSRSFTSALAVQPDISVPSDAALKPVTAPSFTFESEIAVSVLIGLDGHVKLSYQRDQIRDRDAELLCQYYSIVAELISHLDQPLSMILEGMTPSQIRDRLLMMGNSLSDSTADSVVTEDLVTLFESSARKHATLTALEKGERHITYGTLDRKASKVASHLKSHIRPGDVVCVHTDRSINFIVAIYAILKAQGIYCPLDPSIPAETRDSYYQTSGAKSFIIPDRTSQALQPKSCDTWICIEELLEGSVQLPPLSHRLYPYIDANAYICFTSGSTSAPKAVLCHHRGLVAFQSHEQVRLFAKPETKVSQIMSPAFDGSIHEIFSALSYGATLILPAHETGIEHLRKAHSAILTPSLAKALSPREFPSLCHVYLVGEHVSQSINDIWAAEKALYNMYGPTEATCGGTIKRLEHGAPVTIGHPNPSSRAYILDRNQRLLPPGCVGDLYLAGVQVSKGYIGQSDMTRERFLPDSISPKGHQRMYKTGDRAYWDDLGELNFVGRNDRQIKLNGFRLDLNAIEESIAQTMPETCGVALTLYEGSLLVALQPASTDCREVRTKLSSVLPPYAMPEKIFAMDQFPLTPIGKLDYKKIGASCIPETLPMTSSVWGDVEAKVEEVWRETLTLDENISLDARSDFGLLGGHSLHQIAMANKLSDTFRVHIEMKHVIQRPNLGDLAAFIKTMLALPNNQPISSPQFERLGSENVSSIEREWCGKYRDNPKTSSFNISLAYKLDPAVADSTRLEMAWNVVLSRFPVLRSRYVQTGHEFKRLYHCDSSNVLCQDSFDIEHEINKPFKLDSDHLFRVLLSHESLLVCASHIVCDLTTVKILLDEVASLYHGQPLNLCQRLYEDIIVWNKQSNSNNLDYWRQTLSGLESFKAESPRRRSFGGRSRVTRLSNELSKLLFNYLESHPYTTHQVALAAVALAKQCEAPQIDLVLGSPYMNRSREDMNTVGLFLEPLPIRIVHAPSDDLIKLVQDVRNCSQSALRHAIPFSEIVDHLGIQLHYPDHPIFDTMVTFHDDREAEMLALPGATRQMVWGEGSKFELMCEFTALADDTVVLRLEYDDMVFGENDILLMESRISTAVRLICSESSYVKAQQLLVSLRHEGRKGGVGAKVPFGAVLSEL